ncbi:MAG TPA: hypothetical protein VGB62_10935 [Allosphingosinicella sp.]|jgi:hypothetical protein
MLNIRRSLRAAAATILIAAGAAGGSALAQDAAETVGPPQLKDFSLTGERTTPPASPQPQPKAEAPAPRAETPAPRAATPAPRPANPAPRAATPAPTETAPARTETPAAPAPVTAAPPPALNEPIPDLVPEAVPDANAAAPVAPPVASRPLPDEQPFTPVEADPEQAPNYLQWLLYALPVALIGLLLFGLSRLRRRRQMLAEEQVREAARNELGDSLLTKHDAARPLPEPALAPEAEPAPQPAPAPVISDAARAALAAATAKRSAPAAPAQPRVFKVDAPAPAPAPKPPEPVLQDVRAWLEIDIEPEKATATDSEAAVHYNMILRNSGTAAAKNIRIDARLFNAADEADIMAFFQGPIHEVSGSPHVVLQPEGGIYLLGQVAMPKDKVREVRVEGRALFIPMVAINVAYDWLEEGKGRTSKSWLVGRQTEQAAAKMGAFRLDLGPRIYRQVAQREGKRVMV